jgi:hypothetical protein
MYDPPKFLTMEVLAAIAAEFEWPAPYTLEDDLPDGILMRFPASNLYFTEGFESEMSLKFLTEDTGADETLTLGDAFRAIQSDPARFGSPPEPALDETHLPTASLAKVQLGLRNLCKLVLTYFRPCLLGDFSWVDAYRALGDR